MHNELGPACLCSISFLCVRVDRTNVVSVVSLAELYQMCFPLRVKNASFYQIFFKHIPDGFINSSLSSSIKKEYINKNRCYKHKSFCAE